MEETLNSPSCTVLTYHVPGEEFMGLERRKHVLVLHTFLSSPTTHTHLYISLPSHLTTGWNREQGDHGQPVNPEVGTPWLVPRLHEKVCVQG